MRSVWILLLFGSLITYHCFTTVSGEGVPSSEPQPSFDQCKPYVDAALKTGSSPNVQAQESSSSSTSSTKDAPPGNDDDDDDDDDDSKEQDSQEGDGPSNEDEDSKDDDSKGDDDGDSKEDGDESDEDEKAAQDDTSEVDSKEEGGDNDDKSKEDDDNDDDDSTEDSKEVDGKSEEGKSDEDESIEQSDSPATAKITKSQEDDNKSNSIEGEDDDTDSKEDDDDDSKEGDKDDKSKEGDDADSKEGDESKEDEDDDSKEIKKDSEAESDKADDDKTTEDDDSKEDGVETTSDEDKAEDESSVDGDTAEDSGEEDKPDGSISDNVANEADDSESTEDEEKQETQEDKDSTEDASTKTEAVVSDEQDDDDKSEEGESDEDGKSDEDDKSGEDQKDDGKSGEDQKEDGKSDEDDGKSDEDDGKSDEDDGKSDEDDGKSDEDDDKSDEDDDKSEEDKVKGGADKSDEDDDKSDEKVTSKVIKTDKDDGKSDEDDDKSGEKKSDEDDDKSEEKDDDEDKTEETDSDEESEEDDDDDDDGVEETYEPRSRDHVTEILRLDDSDKTKNTYTQLDKATQGTLKDLKRIYENAIKPLETLYKYRDLSNRHFGDPEIFSKPLVVFMGPWSGGKSTIINWILDIKDDETALRTGADPSPAQFNIMMYGKEEEVLDGTQLAADWTFSGLQKFGQSFLDRLRGRKLPNRLLEKVNIVEIPGILEVRKQVERSFPFNDACQWFIDRADVLFLVYDPAKLDIGPETEAILDQLKGRENQVRIILNKADSVNPDELLRLQAMLVWNISPLMSSAEPPVMYVASLWDRPFKPDSPKSLLTIHENNFLKDIRDGIEKQVETRIAAARRFAVRVRNHAKMVDCYLNTYNNHRSFFSDKKKISNDIIDHPQNYHIYEGLSTLTNISRYDLPDPDTYRDFFKLNHLWDFPILSSTCSYFRGCPINKLDIAIAYELPEVLGKFRRQREAILTAQAQKPSSTK